MQKETYNLRHSMGLRQLVAPGGDLQAVQDQTYGVASLSRLLKIIGLFCERALEKRRYSAEGTYHFKDPTNRSRHIVVASRHCRWN